MPNLLSTLAPSATHIIRLDHAHVLVTFHRYRADTAPATKQAIAETLCLALEIHARIEEEVFYPAVRALMPDNEVVARNVPEHDEMRRLIAELRESEPGTRRFDDLLLELMRDVMHHVADEETVLLPAAERAIGDQLGELGARMTRRKLQLAAPHAGTLALDTVRGMPVASVVALAAAVGVGALIARGMQRN